MWQDLHFFCFIHHDISHRSVIIKGQNEYKYQMYMLRLICRHYFKCNVVVFPQLYISCRSAGFRPLYIPNGLLIDLQESNLHGNEREFDRWIPVSVNCGKREQWSPWEWRPSGSYMCLMGMICHHPSELMLSMCWSHYLRLCGLCDGATLSKQNTICHIPVYDIWNVYHWLR